MFLNLYAIICLKLNVKWLSPNIRRRYRRIIYLIFRSSSRAQRTTQTTSSLFPMKLRRTTLKTRMITWRKMILSLKICFKRATLISYKMHNKLLSSKLRRMPSNTRMRAERNSLITFNNKKIAPTLPAHQIKSLWTWSSTMKKVSFVGNPSSILRRVMLTIKMNASTSKLLRPKSKKKQLANKSKIREFYMIVILRFLVTELN